MLHPTKYAAMLADRMREHGATAWLVNTGWSGGRYPKPYSLSPNLNFDSGSSGGVRLLLSITELSKKHCVFHIFADLGTFFALFWTYMVAGNYRMV